jgi:hypothetical protein
MNESIRLLNLPITVLLIVIVFFWLSVVLGMLDFDFDFDTDTDFDAELDIDGGIFRGMLSFFYIGELPVMVLLSIGVFSMWVLTIMGSHYFNSNQVWYIATGLDAVNFLITLFVCKIVGYPFAKLFKMFKVDANGTAPAIGRECIIMTTQVSKKMGQAEMNTKRAPLLLNVI